MSTLLEAASEKTNKDDTGVRTENVDYTLSDSDRASIDPIANYMAKIKAVRLLTREEEISLSKKAIAGDSQAREHLIRANLRLVVKIAYEFKSFGMPIMDLICEGNIGLLKAVERYNPDKGAKLSSYVSWWIRHAIKQAIASHGKTIRLPIHQIDRMVKIRQISAKLEDALDREPTNDEIAKELGIPVSKVAHLNTLTNGMASLNAPIGNDGNASLMDFVRDDNENTPYEKTSFKSLSNSIKKILNLLSEREASIIKKRFGFNGQRPMTLQEVSEEINITRERVRQIQSKALKKIRNTLSEFDRQRTVEEVKEYQVAKGRNAVIQQFIAERLAS